MRRALICFPWRGREFLSGGSDFPSQIASLSARRNRINSTIKWLPGGIGCRNSRKSERAFSSSLFLKLSRSCTLNFHCFFFALGLLFSLGWTWKKTRSFHIMTPLKIGDFDCMLFASKNELSSAQQREQRLISHSFLVLVSSSWRTEKANGTNMIILLFPTSPLVAGDYFLWLKREEKGHMHKKVLAKQ